MKTLKEYISESILNEATTFSGNDVIVTEVEAKYDCQSDFYLQAPESYSESDIQIYIDDTFLKKLPSGNTELGERLFGINWPEIVDAHFEYDFIEPALGKSQKADLTWDESYDKELNSTTLLIYHVKNLKYVISFDKFEMKDAKGKNLKDIMYEIFRAACSSDEISYDPLTISLNKDNISYN